MTNINIQIDHQNMPLSQTGSIGANQSILALTGNIVKGTVSGLGDKAEVTIGENRFQVNPDIVKDKKLGDEMRFEVQPSDGKSVVLKAMQDFAGVGNAEAGDTKEQLRNLSQVQIQHNTDQFVNILSESDLKVNVTTEAVNDAKASAKLSSEDLKMLRQMGIDVNSADISHLMGLVNQYHQQQEGRSFETGSAEVVEQIAKAQNMSKISDGARRYMMQQGMDLTYENVYKAEYSASTMMPAEGISEQDWAQLKSQVEARIADMGQTVSDANVAAAKWMLMNGVELNASNMQLYSQIDTFNENGVDAVQYAQNIVAQLEVGELADSAPMIGESNASVAKEVVAQLQQIGSDAVKDVVEKEEAVTVDNLFLAQRRMEAKVITQEDNPGFSQQGSSGSDSQEKQKQSGDNKADSENKNLQELRLRMTLQAGYRLLNNGVNLRNTELSEMITELNHLEETMVDGLLRDSKVPMTAENANLYQDTMVVVDTIPYLPAASLGAHMSADQALSMTDIYRTGMRYAERYAGTTDQYGNPIRFETVSGVFTSYEEMMTKPRGDMGDSIRKAFSSIPSFLEELGIEPTKENEKATRILAYNQMEITQDNIDRIRELDAKINSVVESMKPEYVLGMIRDGKNPLTMNLDDMAAEIALQQEIQGEGLEEKYSEFLYRLDRKGEISQEERDSFIGIYRMLHAIRANDGRDLGSVVRNGQELNFENLLSAHRSRKQQGMNVGIDDAYGIVSERYQNGQSITEQIGAAFVHLMGADEKETQMNRNALNMQNIQPNPGAIHVTDAEVETELAQLEQEEFAQLSDVKREAVELLNRLELPNSKGYLLAAKQMATDSVDLYKEMKKVFRQRGAEGTENFASMETEMLEHIKRMDELFDVNEEVTHAVSMDEGSLDEGMLKDVTEADAFDLKEAFAQQIHELDEGSTFTLRDMQMVRKMHAMTHIATRQQVKESVYHIPVVVGEEVLTMKVAFAKGEEKGFVASVATDTFGIIEGKYVVGESDLPSARMEILCDSEEGRQAIAENQSALLDALAEQGVAANGLDSISSRTMYEAAKAFVAFVREIA